MATLVIRLRPIRAAVALVLYAAAGGVWGATGDPLQLRLDYQMTRDSNFFRLPNEVPPSAEVIQVLSAGLVLDKTLSRQNVRVQLSASTYRYQQHRTLDFDGFNFQGDWRWQIGNDWSGIASYGQSDTAGSYEEVQSQNLRPYKIRQRTRSFNANYKLGAVTSLWATLSEYQRDSSLSTSDRVDNSSNEVGVRFYSGSGSYTDLSYRAADTTYPNQQSVSGTLVDNGYKDREIRASTHWIYSGKTSVDGWLGLYMREHNQLTERDVSGLQGRIAANWAATGHVFLTGELWRTLSPIEQLTANYTRNRGVGLTAIWAVSSMVTVRGRVSREEREWQGDPGYVLSSGPRRNDTLIAPELAVDYHPWRNGGLSLKYQAPERRSNYPSTGYEDSAWIFSAFGQF